MQKIWVCGARGQIGQAVNDVVDKLEFENHKIMSDYCSP